MWAQTGPGSECRVNVSLGLEVSPSLEGPKWLQGSLCPASAGQALHTCMPLMDLESEGWVQIPVLPWSTCAICSKWPSLCGFCFLIRMKKGPQGAIPALKLQTSASQCGSESLKKVFRGQRRVHAPPSRKEGDGGHTHSQIGV